MDLLLDVDVVIVVVFVEVDLHMWQLCMLRPCTWGSTQTSRVICSVRRAPYRGGGIRPDLARGQHGDEESLDHDRLLLRVGVLARHVHVRGPAVVGWRQLHHRPVVGEGELKLAKLHAQHTDAAHLVRVRSGFGFKFGFDLGLELGPGLRLGFGFGWLRVRFS